MICPACLSQLSPLTIRGVTVDVCQEGCAGIWFDNFELKKFDEPHEPAGELLNLRPVRPAPVDREKKRKCPRCDDAIMMRHFFSFKKQFEVDVCPNCAGCWLDAGEIALVRQEFKTESEKQQATQTFVKAEAAPQLIRMLADSRAKLQHAQAIASLFRAVGSSVD
jgi:Zn-finger nucleic acid-binding protein